MEVGFDLLDVKLKLVSRERHAVSYLTNLQPYKLLRAAHIISDI